MSYRRVLVPLEKIEAVTPLMMQIKGLFAGKKVHFDAMRANVLTEPHLPVPLITSWPMVGGFSSLSMIDHSSAPELKNYFERYKVEVEAQRKHFREAFTKACSMLEIDVVNHGKPSSSPISASWVARQQNDDADFGDDIVEQSRFSDLTIAARPTERDDIWLSVVVSNILFDAAQPLLLLPVHNNTRNFDGFPKKVGIAWNGSNESSQAVQHAMPFIEAAEEVIIFTATGKKTSEASADNLVYWLERHDIKPKTVLFEQSSVSSVGETILDECQKHNVEFLISGAYSHSRLRSFILGGVTTYLLTNSSIPLFMSH